MTRVWTVTAIALVGFAVSGMNAVQAALITGVTASASSEEAPVSNLVDYAKSTFDAANHWVIGEGSIWNTTNGVSKASTWVKFDMGEVKTLGQMSVFNYASYGTDTNCHNRRFVTADIWYCASTPTVDNPTDAAPGNWLKLNNDYSFSEASPYHPTSSDPYKTPTSVSLGVSARYVLLNDIVNGGETVWGNGYGLHTVEFYTASAPEPASATLLTTTGLLGLLCYAWQRRK